MPYDTPKHDHPCPYGDELGALPVLTDRLERLTRDLEQLSRHIYGNGAPSIVTRVTLLERQVQETSRAAAAGEEWRRKLTLAAITAIVTSVASILLSAGAQILRISAAL